MCINRTVSWIEQQSSCFNWFNTQIHTPLRQSRSPTLALPQDLRGSCVSQAESSPHPPPCFLPAPLDHTCISRPISASRMLTALSVTVGATGVNGYIFMGLTLVLLAVRSAQTCVFACFYTVCFETRAVFTSVG